MKLILNQWFWLHGFLLNAYGVSLVYGFNVVIIIRKEYVVTFL